MKRIVVVFVILMLTALTVNGLPEWVKPLHQADGTAFPVYEGGETWETFYRHMKLGKIAQDTPVGLLGMVRGLRSNTDDDGSETILAVIATRGIERTWIGGEVFAFFGPGSKPKITKDQLIVVYGVYFDNMDTEEFMEITGMMAGSPGDKLPVIAAVYGYCTEDGDANY